MATNAEMQMEALERRLIAVEERINQLQTMLGNVATSRALTGVRVALEDVINTLQSEVLAQSAEINNIKTRLRMN